MREFFISLITNTYGDNSDAKLFILIFQIFCISFGISLIIYLVKKLFYTLINRHRGSKLSPYINKIFRYENINENFSENMKGHLAWQIILWVGIVLILVALNVIPSNWEAQALDIIFIIGLIHLVVGIVYYAILFFVNGKGSIDSIMRDRADYYKPDMVQEYEITSYNNGTSWIATPGLRYDRNFFLNIAVFIINTIIIIIKIINLIANFFIYAFDSTYELIVAICEKIGKPLVRASAKRKAIAGIKSMPNMAFISKFNSDLLNIPLEEVCDELCKKMCKSIQQNKKNFLGIVRDGGFFCVLGKSNYLGTIDVPAIGKDVDHKVFLIEGKGGIAVVRDEENGVFPENLTQDIGFALPLMRLDFSNGTEFYTLVYNTVVNDGFKTGDVNAGEDYLKKIRLYIAGYVSLKKEKSNSKTKIGLAYFNFGTAPLFITAKLEEVSVNADKSHILVGKYKTNKKSQPLYI